MNAVAKCLLAAILTFACSGNSARSQQPAEGPWDKVILPVWWGGECDSSSAALTAAKDWCAETAAAGKNGEVRGWRWGGGEGAFAACVLEKSKKEKPAGQRSQTLELRNAEASLAKTKLRVKELALRCLLLPKEEPIARWVVAAEGLRSLDGLDVRGSLAPGVAIEEFEVGSSRAFVISISKSQVANGEIVGLSTERANRCVAAGILSLPTASGSSFSQIVSQALVLSHDIDILKLAATRAYKNDDGQALGIALLAYGDSIFSLVKSDLDTWAPLCRLAKHDDYLTTRIASYPDEVAALGKLAEELRATGLTKVPVLITGKTGASIFVALDRAQASDFEVRDTVALIGGATGGVIVPEIALSVKSQLVLPESAATRFQKGASIHADQQAGFVFAEPSDVMDLRLRKPSSRIFLEGSLAKSRSEALSAAAMQRAAQLGLWDKLSTWPISQMNDQLKYDAYVVYALQLASGKWEVDLDPSLDTWLHDNDQADQPTVSVVKLEGLLANLDGDVRKALAGIARVSGDAESALKVNGKALVKSVERGADEDTGFIEKKEWVRNQIQITLTLDVNGEQVSVVEEVQGIKVFGGAKTERFDLAAAASGITTITKRLPAVFEEMSRKPLPAVLKCKEDDLPQGMRNYAASRKDLQFVAAPLIDKDAGSKAVLYYVKWPGGCVGLRRALDCLARSGALADLARYEIRPPNADESKKFFK